MQFIGKDIAEIKLSRIFEMIKANYRQDYPPGQGLWGIFFFIGSNHTVLLPG